MDIALSLLVLTCIALLLGAFVLWQREGYRRQAVLMLVLAVVMAINVLIWTLPTSDGDSLVDAAQDERAPE